MFFSFCNKREFGGMARIRLVGLYQIIAMNVDEAVLDESPLFKDMTRYQRRKAILISELRDFSPGEKLVEQGTKIHILEVL